MKGQNTLKLNQETMIQAIQLWLDSEMREGKSPTVTTVSATPSSGYPGAATFEVVTEIKEA